MNVMNRCTRFALAVGCLLWAGVAHPGPSGIAVGGPTDGKSSDQESTARSTASGADSSSTAEPSATADLPTMAGATTGTISKIDADQSTIELQGKGDRKLRVDPSTEIRRNGQKASFSDLHEGDEVRASFASEGQAGVKELDVTSESGTSNAKHPSPTRSSRSSSSSDSSGSSSSSSSGR